MQYFKVNNIHVRRNFSIKDYLNKTFGYKITLVICTDIKNIIDTFQNICIVSEVFRKNYLYIQLSSF